MHFWFYKFNKYLRPCIDTIKNTNIEQFYGSSFLFVISDKTLELNSPPPPKKKKFYGCSAILYFWDGGVKMF